MKVIIMCGVSGSGKSTYVDEHFKNRIKFSVDDYLLYDESNPYHDKETLKRVHKDCLRDFIETIHHHTMLPRYNWEYAVVDNANTTITGIAPYISVAIAYGYEVEIIMLDCDPLKAYMRNVHNIPWEDVRAQFLRLQQLESRWSSWWPKIRRVRV